MAIKAIFLDCFGVLYVERKLGFTNRQVLNQIVLDFSQSLRPKYKIGLLTNMNVGVVDKYFTQDELHNYFDAVVISGNVNVVKPEPAIYKLAAKTLSLQTQECVLVDDNQDNCDGAVQAGMKAILYESAEQIKSDLTALLAKN